MSNEPNTSARGLSLRDAADLAGVSERTMRRLAIAGKVPAFRIGGQYRVLTDFIETLLEEQKLRSRASAEA